MKSKYKIIVIPPKNSLPEHLWIKKDGKSAWIHADGETLVSESFLLYPEDLEFLAYVGKNFRFFVENGKTFQQWDGEEKN